MSHHHDSHGHGHAHSHVHGVDDDHDEGEEIPLEENPIWLQDNVMLRSVGVDIGSSGTQIAFSRLHMRRLSEDLTSRFVVVRRETHYQSEVHLTPFVDDAGDLFIDAIALGNMLDAAYAEARVLPEEVDTGAVILTGEALRRRNAELIASVISQRAGDLVCASAGHHMEAMLAAYGSGAVLGSHRQKARILNVDIGGGTTKLTLVDSGRITATAAYHVGGRLVATDAEGMVIRLEPGGLRHAQRAGVEVASGGSLDAEGLAAIAQAMADELIAILRDEPSSDPGLWLTDPLPRLGSVDGLIFSGGVAEYVYDTETRTFGDLGPDLGRALAAAGRENRLIGPILPADARIRATVLGASEYTVQLSGVTSYISDPANTLPRRNLRVMQPEYEVGESVDSAMISEAIAGHLERFSVGDSEEIAIALRWDGAPEYRRVRALGEAIVKGLAPRIAAGGPLYLMLDADIARTLGLLLREELGVENELVVLDGVLLRDFDYVDLGRLREPSGTVPVTIKSLVFSAMDQ